MIVEAIRLLVTLTATASGFIIGSRIAGDAAVNAILGATIGAGIGYVFGGGFGRLTNRALDLAPRVLVPRSKGPQLFAGSFGLAIGLLIGIVIALPLWIFLPPIVGWPLGTLVIVLAGAFCARVFAGRAEDLLAAVGLRPRGPLVARRLDRDEQMFVVDSSAAIDGRLLDLVKIGLVVGTLVVPLFVLDEMQAIADSGDRNRRRRGRRGLDVIESLRDTEGVDVVVAEDTVPGFEEVDAKLAALADRLGATLVTTDHNLGKAASVRGIAVLNPHLLGEMLRAQASVGDQVAIEIEKLGSEPGQGVGYLDDGTMVVVEGAGPMVGSTVTAEISNTLRTQMGRMLFARLAA